MTIIPIITVIGMKIIRKIKVLMIEQTPDRIVFRTEPLTLNKNKRHTLFAE